jgi:phage gp36-like protein
MAYCAYTDLPISPQVPINDTGAQITTTMAGNCIDTISADIDSHLRAKNYVLPVTDPEALALLKAICINGALSSIYKMAFPTDEGVGASKGAAEFYEERYQKQLANIDKGFLGPDTAEDSDHLINISGWAAEHHREKPWVFRDTRW